MKKMLTAILSFTPIISLPLGFIMLFAGVFIGEAGNDIGWIILIFSYLLLFAAVIVTWVDIIWFIIIVCKKREWPSDKKVLWGLLIYFFNVFVFPVFWWKCLKDE